MNNIRHKFPERAVKFVCVLAAALVLMSMAGCASVGRTKLAGDESAAKREDLEKNNWWYARFQMNWSQKEDVEPAWHMDLLIAHRIVKPVLERYRKDISLWRFHRRAAPDSAGHQFSFIFYCPADKARKIYAAIESSALLDEMKSAGLILRELSDDTKKPTRPNIESVSDPSWSSPLQKSWPYFAMGVSETWLDLITRLAGDGRPKPLTLWEMQPFYQEITGQVDGTWTKEGGHAFLHHLNALFGYEPVNIRGKGPMRF